MIELKPTSPFTSPLVFEETMQEAVQNLADFLRRKHGLNLLGTGMHPLMSLNETAVWPHRDRSIYEALNRIFPLKRHGWLNIQGYQLNLPYQNERDAVSLHNMIGPLCAYLPALSASSPIFEGRFGQGVDNRLIFYRENQKEVPSITGDIIPEYISSLSDYRTRIIERYTNDLRKAGASKILLCKEWINSRGAILRSDRKAIEIRIMDEQECIKSDVALSCFIRATVRGLLSKNPQLQPHDLLVKDLNAVIERGLSAKTLSPYGRTARDVCSKLFSLAWENASDEEKRYLEIMKKKLKNGNLSNVILRRVKDKTQKTDLREAVISVYSGLARSLIDNKPQF